MKRLHFCVLILLLLIVCPALFGSQSIAELTKQWFIAENAVLSWYNDTLPLADAQSALEQFRIQLRSFTGSQLFIQYERTALLSKENSNVIFQLLDTLDTAVEKAEKYDAIMGTMAVRQELLKWADVDSEISSKVVFQFTYIFYIFLLCVIILTIAIVSQQKALHRSQIKEKDSAEFSRITMLAQEKERTLISADLHDTVLQDLGRLVQMSKDEKQLNSFSKLAEKIIERTKDLCRGLMPPDFSRLTLADSLVQLCADFEKRTSIECRSIIAQDFSADKLSNEMQLQIFRIVQEVLTNIEKHSKAKEVTLLARNLEEALLFCISDDGIGLGNKTKKSNVQSGGMGIRGMYQRAALLGASLRRSAVPLRKRRQGPYCSFGGSAFLRFGR
jgi:signal transduction histidine kinase